jgi:hypothetical protein
MGRRNGSQGCIEGKEMLQMALWMTDPYGGTAEGPECRFQRRRCRSSRFREQKGDRQWLNEENLLEKMYSYLYIAVRVGLR